MDDLLGPFQTMRPKVRVQANQHRSHTNERMEGCHKFWHPRHFHALGKHKANARAHNQSTDQHRGQRHARSGDRGQDRHGHADNAVPDRAFRTFLT